MTRGAAAALVLLVLLPGLGHSAPSPAPPFVSPAQRIRGIVFDPTDYYATGMNAGELAAMLVSRWSQAGVNVVYVNAYNVIYGAHYRTAHRFTRMDDFGRADLLGIMLREAHRRGMQVFASFYSHTHRGAWTANPHWRAKRADGRDYSPRGVDVQYFLSIWHADVVAWWDGLIEEILAAYPDLDGIELREPVINWWGTDADYNASAVAAFRAAVPGQPLGGAAWRRWRAEGLTRFIKRTIQVIHRHGRQVHLTSVASAWGDGRVMTSWEQAEQTGFDLDGVLSGEELPDGLKPELIWQQWGNVYNFVTFSPAWTGRATAAVLRMIGVRTRAIIHVELTDFGRRVVSPEETYLAMRAARRAGARDFDVYGARLADDKAAWPWLRRALTEDDPAPRVHPPDAPVRRVLVLEDVDRDRSGIPRLATTMLLNLLGHFDLISEVRTTAAYARGTLDDYDAVIYQGTVWDAPLPGAMADDVARFGGPVLWIGANLWQLTRGEPLSRFGVLQQPPVPQHPAESVSYRGVTFPAQGLRVLGFERDPAAAALATAAAGGVRTPLAVRSGRFFYVAGHLFTVSERNPLQWIVADLLHEVLQTPHRDGPEALLMLTGITPLTDPALLAGVRAALPAEGVPVLLSVTPVFVDPVTQVRVRLAERPAVIDELRGLTRNGAAIVLAGYTHQYRGRTGQDYEFWDAQTGTAVGEDSTEYVETRVRSALREVLDAGLVPIAWATPGGLASPFDYTLLGEMFSAVIERRFYGFAGGEPARQRFPFRVGRDVHGHTVLSPNVELQPRGDPAEAEATARRLQVVRDALAVAAVSVSTPADALAGLVRMLRAQGYHFADLREREVIEIRSTDVAVVGRGGKARLHVTGPGFVQEYDVDRRGRRAQASATWVNQPLRLERAPSLPPGTLRVIDVRAVSAWSVEGLRLRLRILAGPWLGWVPQRDVVGVLRLAVVALSLLSVAIVIVLGIAHVMMRLVAPR